MCARTRWLLELLAQKREDVVLSNDHGAILEPESRNRSRAGCLHEHSSLGRFDRHLAIDVVDAELGQPLANAS
jgi:hypothetical protein